MLAREPSLLKRDGFFNEGVPPSKIDNVKKGSERWRERMDDQSWEGNTHPLTRGFAREYKPAQREGGERETRFLGNSGQVAGYRGNFPTR